MELPKQFDNITQRVIDDLKATLKSGSRVSMAAASFSIYAFEALQAELEKVDELRFIFTSPTFNKETSKKQKREFYIPKLNRERTLYGSDFEIKLRNNLTQKAIAKECADWIRQKVRFKTNVSQMQMPGFLNVKTDGELLTYMPFNEFTTTELGCERGNNIFQLIQRLPSPISDAYLKNFAESLEYEDDVVVYTKLPNGFYINTPMGKYNPDWAVAFREGSVKHVYFLAESKVNDLQGSQLRGSEESKIECARRHFKAISDNGYIYDVAKDYKSLYDIVTK